MKILIFGAPGSGKGTQASKIKEKFGLFHISTGELLRNYVIENNDEMSAEIKSVLSMGKLVSDDVIFNLLKLKIESIKEKGYIIDGFPRNLSQAEMMSEKGIIIDRALFLDIPEGVLIKRLTGRFSCKNCGEVYNKYYRKPKVDNVCDKCLKSDFEYRIDDNEETIKERLLTYNNYTKPLYDYYNKKGVLSVINANQGENEVFKNIMEVLVF